jgi:hypothetical protein
MGQVYCFRPRRRRRARIDGDDLIGCLGLVALEGSVASVGLLGFLGRLGFEGSVVTVGLIGLWKLVTLVLVPSLLGC